MFKIGDKVRVIKYGHPMLYHIENYHKMMEFSHNQPSFIEFLMGIEKVIREPYKAEIPKHLISMNDTRYIVDMNPEMVGREGIVQVVKDSQYSLAKIKGKTAWYNEDQLELI